jgi:hypothetical protein
MATTIKLKNSVVKDKVPLPSGLEIGELAVGAHSESPALFFKDNADNIIKLEPGSGVEPSPTPPVGPNEGDLWYDTGKNTLNYWDGASWVELGQAGDSPVTSVNGEVGVVVLDAADVGALAPGDDVSELTNDAGYITAADVNDGKITIVDADGGAVGEFTVNQAGDTEISLPAIPETTGFVKLDDDGTEQSIIGGGGLDVVGGITSEFGTNAAQLGNIAPLNDWSCYPARPTTFYATPVPPPHSSPTPTPEPQVPTFSGGVVSGDVIGSGGFTSAGSMDIIDLGDA